MDRYVATSFKNMNKAILFGEEILKELPEVITKDEIQLYFLFRGSDCTNCITETWEMLEGLIKNNYLEYKQINYYYYTDDLIDIETLINKNNINISKRDVIEFNYESILLDTDITISPILIISYSGVIVDAYQPEPSNLVTRDAFWKKWRFILANQK